MRQDKRIVIDVDDPGVRGYPLGDLVGIVLAGQPGADIEELADLHLTRQVTDNPGDEIAGRASLVEDTRIELRELVTGLFVDRVVILAAQPVVPNPGRYRNRGVDLREGEIGIHNYDSPRDTQRKPAPTT